MRLLRSLLLSAAVIAGTSPAIAQQFQNVPDHSVIGRIGVGGQSGPSQAIPWATFLPNLAGAQAANKVWAGPASGGNNTPNFRLLVGADLPNPGASSLGGVQSKTCSSSNWLNALSTGGVLGCLQPSFSDLIGSIAPSQIPNPSATTLGGVKSLAAISHQFLTSISTTGQPTQAQPACGDLSNSSVYCPATLGQLPGTATNDSASAGNIGELLSNSVSSGSPVSLTTGTPIDITTLSLTAGDWDVSANIYYGPASTTNVTVQICSISATLNTLDLTTLGAANNIRNGGFVPGSGGTMNCLVGPLRISLSGTTTYHLVTQANFTVSTLSGYGIIRARRVR